MPDSAEPRLPIAGLTRLTTLDFPDRLACVVFLQGCPLRCGYCHNPQMLASRRGARREWAEVRAFLEARRGLLEGVVFSGGEPAMHHDLAAAVRQARELGFAVGLHTAGAYPDRLHAMLPQLDWVGLDVKGEPGRVDAIIGRPGLAPRLARSLDVLLEGGVAFECRTTVHWRDFELADVERLAIRLAERGVRRYALQLARHDQCLDPDYHRPVPGAPTAPALEALARRLRPHFTQLTLRH
ncbi:anaerobic ribonucleoside-triphosphate reductase activating protein [Halomonas nitroreducens]|uniref:Anaerobic ribonucleoside-triphosphate reductase activating protein n=1 Tax=Halomonas nitroreducens TaxID=447425 RepID=A0A431V3M1_9GAMM|nr:anaerobic ribonucleoside-triphosphate reductase activating protein [Halomonas nitroreducens]RTR04469.1 anaerobic ribonucleoside-triphosphate reductase activating protein [Halomonas nitroreducens]